MNEDLDLSKDPEIEKALQQFEVENKNEPASVMVKKAARGMAEWLKDHSGGVIKTEEQAEYVLLGFVAVCVMVSLVLIFGVGRAEKGEIKAPPGKEIVYPPDGPPRLELKLK